MTTRAETIRTKLAWYEALTVVVVGILGTLQTRTLWTGLLCAFGAGIAFGVWRCVRLLGHIVEHTQLQAGVYDQDEQDA